MLFRSLFVLALASSVVVAQRPSSTSICDYYTTALLIDNTGANQYTLLSLIVNTVVIGNYTQPNVGITVPGILAPGTYNGTAVNLAPYFSGTLASSNRNGVATAVNFLDGGGAAPLKMNMPANSNTTNQYFLLTHLYEFFGALLGCSEIGMAGFPAYSGQASMYEVHKFMVLGSAEMGYFITQVGLAATSFGISQADATSIGTALETIFDYKCLPQSTVIPAQGPQFQSICTDASCSLLATSDVCGSAQASIAPPMSATPSMSSTSTSSSSTTQASSTTSTSSTSPTASTTSPPIKKLSSGAEAGIAVGAVGGVLILLGLLFIFCRRSRSKQVNEPASVSPAPIMTDKQDSATAFEPNPADFDREQRNLSASGYDRDTCNISGYDRAERMLP